MPAKNISGRSGLLANHAFGVLSPSTLLAGSGSAKLVIGTTQRFADAQPAFPMHALRIADICGAAVRFHLQQLLEIDIFALGAQLIRSVGRRFEQRLAGARQPPAHHRQLATGWRIAHDRRHAVGPYLDLRAGGAADFFLAGIDPIKIADVDGCSLVRV